MAATIDIENPDKTANERASAVPQLRSGGGPFFPWRLFLVALFAATAGHWLAAGFYHQAALRLGSWLAPGSFAATCGFALWLRHAHHRHPHPHRKRDAALQFLLIWCVFGSAIWFSLACEHWLLEGPFHLAHYLPVFLLLAAAGVIGFSYWHHRLAPGFAPPRSLRPSPVQELPEAHRFKVLILCVSTPNREAVIHPSQALPAGIHAQVAFGEGEGTALLRGESITADIAEIQRAAKAAHEEECRRAKQAGKTPPATKPYWNWQQLLRALEHHSNLKQVWLLGSPGARGSHSHLMDCQQILARYGRGDVHCLQEAVEFEDFNQLVRAIRRLLEAQLRAVPAAEIGVDVTGGQKVASIAGAAFTMNRELRIQYVQTNEPWDPIVYQLLFDSPPSPHGHN